MSVTIIALDFIVFIVYNYRFITTDDWIETKFLLVSSSIK